MGEMVTGRSARFIGVACAAGLMISSCGRDPAPSSADPGTSVALVNVEEACLSAGERLGLDVAFVGLADPAAILDGYASPVVLCVLQLSDGGISRIVVPQNGPPAVVNSP